MSCLSCAGWSDAEIIDRHVRLIDEHGWVAMSVDAPVPWTYTIGLRWRLDHPELIAVGLDPTEAHHLFHDIIERIEAGEVLTSGSLVPLPHVEVTLGAVHHRNLLGEWFAQWHPTARACGQGTTSLRALQVQVEQLHDCDVCFDRQRALARPCTVRSVQAVRHPETG